MIALKDGDIVIRAGDYILARRGNGMLWLEDTVSGEGMELGEEELALALETLFAEEF